MFTNIKSFYIIGIGGISLSAIALLLKDKGYKIYGSDEVNSKLIKNLKSEKIEVKIGNAPDFVYKCDAIIVTGAIPENNSDVVLARALNKKIFSRAEVLGKIANDKKLISVAGSHGKTTATGMISSVLLEAELSPTIHIGGILNNINSNLQIGKSDYFITEACEYKDSFLELNSLVSVVLNVQEDHLDYFKNLDNIFKSFNKFIQNTKENGIIIYNYDEKDERLQIPSNAISFGFNDGADVQGKNILEYQNGKYCFDLYYKNNFLCNIKLPCFGRHNIYNTLASAGVAIFLGINAETIKNGIENFKGIERRNEIIKEENEHLIIHDYAHHPTEIEATLATYKKIANKGKMIAVFQPHTFSRTRDLFNQFLKCFNSCDEAWLLPIYPAREKPIKGITSKVLSDKLNENNIKSRYFSSFSSCKSEIIKLYDQTTVIALLGAGDIEKLAHRLR